MDAASAAAAAAAAAVYVHDSSNWRREVTRWIVRTHDRGPPLRSHQAKPGNWRQLYNRPSKRSFIRGLRLGIALRDFGTTDQDPQRDAVVAAGRETDFMAS